MYIAIYDLEHNHIGNIREVIEDINKKVYEFDTSKFVGLCDKDISEATYGILYDGKGTQKYAGFLKDIKQEKGKSEFRFDDLRKIFDTEVLLDFSQSTPSHNLDDIFEKVMEAITSTTDTMNIKIEIAYTIPTDTTDTISIADYTHEYLIENAWKFLKVYLSYYQYYIKVHFNVILQRIEFTFVKNTTTKDIKLNDFVFEKKSSHTKTNKAIATLKFEDNVESGDNQWDASDSTYYGAQPEENRESGNTLPDANGYAAGFAYQKVTTAGASWASATVTDYNASGNKLTKGIGVNQEYCPSTAPTQPEMEAEAGVASGYPDGTVIRSPYYWYYGDLFGLCQKYRYMKKVASTSYLYYKCVSTIVYIPRPSLVEKVYILGNDNVIYSGYPSDDTRIYPVKMKLFEAIYLSEAQFNAVLELVESRYNENIIVKDIESPIPLDDIELYTFINVFDEDGDSKTLPVSEIRMKQGRYQMKLGFKKQFFTEIVKSKEE